MGGAPRAVLGAEVTWQSGWAVSRPGQAPALVAIAFPALAPVCGANQELRGGSDQQTNE